MRGAYGVALASGPGCDHSALSVAPDRWPRWTIEVASAGIADRDRDFRVPLVGGGWVDFDQTARRAVIAAVPRMPTDAEMMHPWLGSIGAATSYLAGQDNFHAGGVVVDGRVWGVLGVREAGKSTALVDLAMHGYPVVSDDLLVLDDATSLSGPGCIDLRAPSADFFGLGEELLDLGPGRERFRVWTTAPPPELPFGGFVLPQWGDDVSMRRMSMAESLSVLAGARSMYHVDGGQQQMLRLLRFPLWQWTRRKDFKQIDLAREALLESIAHTP